MKASVNGVEVEGTPVEIAELMHAMANATNGDVAMLTPKQHDVYVALARHPNGAHYVTLAKELRLDPNAINSRLNSIVHAYDGKVIKRVHAGTFAVVR